MCTVNLKCEEREIRWDYTVLKTKMHGMAIRGKMDSARINPNLVFTKIPLCEKELCHGHWLPQDYDRWYQMDRTSKNSLCIGLTHSSVDNITWILWL